MICFSAVGCVCPALCFSLLVFKETKSKEVCQTGQWNFSEKNVFTAMFEAVAWKEPTRRGTPDQNVVSCWEARSNRKVSGEVLVVLPYSLFPLPSDWVFGSIGQKPRGQLLQSITVTTGSNSAFLKPLLAGKRARWQKSEELRVT